MFHSKINKKRQAQMISLMQYLGCSNIFDGDCTGVDCTALNPIRDSIYVNRIARKMMQKCIKTTDTGSYNLLLLKSDKNRTETILFLKSNLKDCPGEDRSQKVNSIKMLYALELFDNKNYVKAINIFNEINIDAAEVIKLIPELDNKPGKNGKIKGEDLRNALKTLVQYLRSKRSASEESGQDDDQMVQQLELIDTALLKCYLQLNDHDSLTKLLHLNNCKLEEAEKILTLHDKHKELVIFYQTRGQFRKALQLLKEAKQSNAINMTIECLQQLGAENINLIFEFSDSILQEHPKEGLKIFTEDIVEVANLPRPKVLEFLLQKHKYLVVPYLEHVIYTWKETHSLFHNELINLYREDIMDRKANSDDIEHTKSKLLSFLEQSSHYTPEIVIRNFPTDSLFVERAAILEKLGRHEQALAIYIQILGDVNRAIQYCEKTYDSTDEDCRDIFIVLLQYLINPQQNSVGTLAKVPRHPNTCKPDLDTALSVLDRHVDKISPVKALSILPDTVSIARLKYYLHNAMHNQLTVKRTTQVMKGLLYAEHLQVEDIKEYYESKSFIVNDYNACRVCKKRFRNQSALMRYPNGSVVHYSCGL